MDTLQLGGLNDLTNTSNTTSSTNERMANFIDQTS